MSVLGFLLLLLIAAICGSIGQSLAGYDLGGCVISIVVGFIGAYLGLWLAEEMDLPKLWSVNIDGKQFPVVWSVIGSMLLALLVGLIRRGVGPRRRF